MNFKIKLNSAHLEIGLSLTKFLGWSDGGGQKNVRNLYMYIMSKRKPNSMKIIRTYYDIGPSGLLALSGN